MSAEYLIQPLSNTRHRRDQFSCEEPELTEFLQRRALPEMEARASACFVLTPVSDPGRIAGFYTLSAATVSVAKLPGDLAKRFRAYPNLPATLLGRLARDSAFRGAGIGDLLVVSALTRAFNNTATIGSVAILTDPKNIRAADFYRRYGFRELQGSRRMFVTMDEAAAWVRESG